MILPVNLDIAGPERGGFKVTPMRNGKLLVQVCFYGFMENVGISYYPFPGYLKSMILAFEAGAGKSVIWCENISILRFETYLVR